MARLGGHARWRPLGFGPQYPAMGRLMTDAGWEVARQQQNPGSIFGNPASSGDWSSFDPDVLGVLRRGAHLMLHIEPVLLAAGWSSVGGDWSTFDSDHYNARIPSAAWGHCADRILWMVDRMRGHCVSEGLDPTKYLILQTTNEKRFPRSIPGWGWTFGSYLRASTAGASQGSTSIPTNATNGDASVFGLESLTRNAAATPGGYVPGGTSAATHVLIHYGAGETEIIPLAATPYAGVNLQLAYGTSKAVPPNAVVWPVPALYGEACLLDPGYLNLLDAVFGKAMDMHPDLTWSSGSLNGARFNEGGRFEFDVIAMKLRAEAKWRQMGHPFAQYKTAGLHIYPERAYLSPPYSNSDARQLLRRFPSPWMVVEDMAERTKALVIEGSRLMPGMGFHVSETAVAFGNLGYGTGNPGGLDLLPNVPREIEKGRMTAAVQLEMRKRVPGLTHIVAYNDGGSDPIGSYRLLSGNGTPTASLAGYLERLGKIKLGDFIPFAPDQHGGVYEYSSLSLGTIWENAPAF